MLPADCSSCEKNQRLGCCGCTPSRNAVLFACCRSPRREVILLGDFNDFDADVPDVEHNMPTSNVLRRIKSEVVC